MSQSSRLPVIELQSDVEDDIDEAIQVLSDDEVARLIRCGRLPPDQQRQHETNATSSNLSTTFEQQRIRQRSRNPDQDQNGPLPFQSAGSRPVFLVSDNEGQNDDEDDDDDIEVLGEQRLPPSQNPSSDLPSRGGYMIYTPQGRIYQSNQPVRTRGVRRPIGGSGRVPQQRQIETRSRSQRQNNSHTSFSGLDRFINVNGSLSFRNNDVSSRADTLIRHFFGEHHGSVHLGSSQILNIVGHDRNTVTNFNNMISFFSNNLGSGGIGNGENGDEIPRGIMDEIRRREQDDEDRRIQARTKVANKMKSNSQLKAFIPEDQKDIFVNGISSELDSICILCGVGLGEGIPDGSKDTNCDNNIDSDEKRKLILVEKLQSPWQCINHLTTLDKDLSKKIFFGKCGHVYCGRCVNNISRESKIKTNKKDVKRRKKVDLDTVSIDDIDVSQAEFSAPKKCIASGCNRLMTGTYFFRELYI